MKSSPLSHLLLACLLILAILAVGGCGQATPTPTAEPVDVPFSYEELARRYAPTIYQGVATDQDYITAVDFDGDWLSNNNWENQPGGDLSAHVYYSVIETETHWFVFYSLFHPRDYTDDPCEKSEGCHENDMESIQMIVRKDGSPFGQLQAMETLAHGSIYLYPANDSVSEGFLDPPADVKMEEGHPVVFVETYGHGIYGKKIILVPHTIIYRVGDEAQVPEELGDKDVTYRLVPIYDTLWQRRADIGPGKTFDQPFDYRGQTLGYSFDGEDWGQDKANSPWGYDQATGNTLDRGDWFLDPAKALPFHATFEGDFSTEYLYNPYLEDLGLLAR